MKIFSINSYSEFVLVADLHILGKILDSKCQKACCCNMQKINSVIL